MTLPLPERDSTIGNRWQDHLSLVPFQDIAAYWEGKPFGVATIFGFFRSFALWQVLFNILLTVPFSVYLRYYFKQSLLRATVLSFGLSLFFELTQLSALYGFYPGPYRLAAVEFPSIIVAWLDNSQLLEYLNGFVLLGIIVASNAYMFFYLFNEVVRRGVHPMPHDTLSGTAYVAIEIPEKKA